MHIALGFGFKSIMGVLGFLTGCLNQPKEVSAPQIGDLKPSKLVTHLHCHCLPITWRIAREIADFVDGDELPRTGEESLVPRRSNVVAQFP